MANTEVLPSFFKSEKVLSFWFSVVQREGAYYDSPPYVGHWSRVKVPLALLSQGFDG